MNQILETHNKSLKAVEDIRVISDRLKEIGGIRRPDPRKVQTIINMEQLYRDTLKRKKKLIKMCNDFTRIFSDFPTGKNYETLTSIRAAQKKNDQDLIDLENYIIDFPTYAINDMHTAVVMLSDIKLYIDYTALWNGTLESVWILEVYHEYEKGNIHPYPINMKTYVEIKQLTFNFENEFKVLK